MTGLKRSGELFEWFGEHLSSGGLQESRVLRHLQQGILGALGQLEQGHDVELSATRVDA
jgi:hypothetical protein